MRPNKTIWIVGAAAFFVCAYFGQSISLSKQRPLYEGLLTVAAIIFAVIGAWITIIIPRAIDKVVIQKQLLPDSEVRNLDLMVFNIKISTCIIMVVMVFGIVEQIFKLFTWSELVVSLFRAVSFGTLGFATIAQFMALLLVLYHTLDAHEQVQENTRVNQRLNALNELNQTQKKD